MSIRPWQLKELEDIQNVLIEEYRYSHKYIWRKTSQCKTKLEALYALKKFKEDIDGNALKLDDANTWLILHGVVKDFDLASYTSERFDFKEKLFDVIGSQKDGVQYYAEQRHHFTSMTMQKPDGRRLKTYCFIATRMYPEHWEGVHRDETGGKITDAVKLKALRDFEATGQAKWCYSFVLMVQKAADGFHPHNKDGWLEHEFRIPDFIVTVDGVKSSNAPPWHWVLGAMRHIANQYSNLNPGCEWLLPLKLAPPAFLCGDKEWPPEIDIKQYQEAWASLTELRANQASTTTGSSVGLGIRAPILPNIGLPANAPPMVNQTSAPMVPKTTALPPNARPVANVISAPVVPKVGTGAIYSPDDQALLDLIGPQSANTGPTPTIPTPSIPPTIPTPPISQSAIASPVVHPTSTTSTTNVVQSGVKAPSVAIIGLPANASQLVHAVSATNVPQPGIQAPSVPRARRPSNTSPLVNVISAANVPQSGVSAQPMTPSRLSGFPYAMSAPPRMNVKNTPPPLYVDPRVIMSSPAARYLPQNYAGSPIQAPRLRMADGTPFTPAPRQTPPNGAPYPGLPQQNMGSPSPAPRLRKANGIPFNAVSGQVQSNGVSYPVLSQQNMGFQSPTPSPRMASGTHFTGPRPNLPNGVSSPGASQQNMSFPSPAPRPRIANSTPVATGPAQVLPNGVSSPRVSPQHMSFPSPAPRPHMANSSPFTTGPVQVLPNGLSSPGLFQQRIPVNGPLASLNQPMSEQEQTNLIQNQESALLRRNSQHQTYPNIQKPSPPQQQQGSQITQQQLQQSSQVAQQHGSPIHQQRPQPSQQKASPLAQHQQQRPQQRESPARQQRPQPAQQQTPPLAQSQQQLPQLAQSPLAQQQPSTPQQYTGSLFANQQRPAGSQQHPFFTQQEVIPTGQLQYSPTKQQGSPLGNLPGPMRFHNRPTRPAQGQPSSPGPQGPTGGLMAGGQQPPFSPGNGYRVQSVPSPVVSAPFPPAGNVGNIYQSPYHQQAMGTGVDVGFDDFDMGVFGEMDMGLMSMQTQNVMLMGMGISMPMPDGMANGTRKRDREEDEANEEEPDTQRRRVS